MAVIGGGVCGLTSAIRLAERGKKVELFEAAPALGGRTRSFYEASVGEWVDNGPHLLIGAYQRTLQLLTDAEASHHMNWQATLNLPLWEQQRGHFSLNTSPRLPFRMALTAAVGRLPGHGIGSIGQLLKVATGMGNIADDLTVSQWVQQLGISQALQRDMLEPLCLGTMNEAMHTANARSFAKVLHDAFRSHHAARLGWFNSPLSQGLIEPLAIYAQKLGVRIHIKEPVRQLQQSHHCVNLKLNQGRTTQASQVILAMPAYAGYRLLGEATVLETSPITNVHFWFEQPLALKESLLGGIGTLGQWFFNVSDMLGQANNTTQTSRGLQHICAVISAHDSSTNKQALVQNIHRELGAILSSDIPMPKHIKVVCEKRATVLVREHMSPAKQERIIDACEAPKPGKYPATIEAAVLRGEAAADKIF